MPRLSSIEAARAVSVELVLAAGVAVLSLVGGLREASRGTDRESAIVASAYGSAEQRLGRGVELRGEGDEPGGLRPSAFISGF